MILHCDTTGTTDSTDMGDTGCPVTACCIVCWPTRNTLFSNSDASTSQPSPVAARWASAAMAPIAPNMPPMMSFTLAPHAGLAEHAG